MASSKKTQGCPAEKLNLSYIRIPGRLFCKLMSTVDIASKDKVHLHPFQPLALFYCGSVLRSERPLRHWLGKSAVAP